MVKQAVTENKAAHDSSTIAKPEAIPPMGDKNPSSRLPDGYDYWDEYEFRRLQEYEPTKDMGMDWYTQRIFGLVDEINRLTTLLDTHQIPHIKARK